MTHKKLQMVSFLIVLLVAFVFVLALFFPFLSILALSVILAILARPLYHRFERKFHTPAWSAALTLFIVVLIILIPLLLFGQLIYREALDVYHDFQSGELVLNRDEIIQSLPVQLQEGIQNLTEGLSDLFARFTANAYQSFFALVSNVANFIISIFFLLFTLYYLLKDGHKIRKVIMDVSPISDRQENILFEKIVAAVNGVVKGSFIIALIQAMVATLGFIIFGLPNPFLWGTVTVLAALVPTIGTSLVMVPAVIYLFITGHTGAGIGLAIWAATAVGLIDNFISPRLIGAQAKLHPVLVLFSVVGGLQLFGFLGFLLGPIFMAVFVAMVDMYRTDFKSYLDR